ncbi:MAG: hypothetical protein PHQ33_07930 [Bacteroidales bacterium]|nr:hypothetical protein [Bacteroidales bacterium]
MRQEQKANTNYENRPQRFVNRRLTLEEVSAIVKQINEQDAEYARMENNQKKTMHVSIWELLKQRRQSRVSAANCENKQPQYRSRCSTLEEVSAIVKQINEQDAEYARIENKSSRVKKI